MERELLFVETLEKVRKTAKDQSNCISEEQVKEAFAAMELNDEQFEQIYLIHHNPEWSEADWAVLMEMIRGTQISILQDGKLIEL